MDRRFLNAYTDPSRFRILGRNLYPWCLKYRVWLTALESPLLNGKPVGPEDLLLAVNVCSEQRIGRFTMMERWRLLRLASKPDNFQKELKRFAEYTMVGHWPKFWEKKSEGGSSGRGMPWPLTIVSNLIQHGIEEKRAWEMPECQAIWMHTAFGIAQGADVNVLSSELEDELDALAKQMADKEGVANPAKVKTP